MTASTTLRPVPTSTRGIRVLIAATSVDHARELRDRLHGLGGVHAQGARSADEAASMVRDSRVDVLVVEVAALDSDELRSALEANAGVGTIIVGNGRGLRMNRSFATCTVEHAADVADELHSVLEQARALRRRETMVRWLEREARTDSLTGLNNRPAFDEELQKVCQEPGANVGLLLINVVGTGTVNYNYGQETGDRMLRHAAMGIMRSIRAEDTAARLGEDNFGVIVRNAGIDLCRLLARRVTHQLELMNRTEWTNDIPVSVTFGLACGTDCEADDLFREAGRQLTLERAFMPPPPLWGNDDGPSIA